MLPIPADDAPSLRAAADTQEIAATAAELVACGSLEMGADAPEDAQRIAALLPAGTPVYVNHLPRRELAHTLPALVALSEAGLEPVPHAGARRIVSRARAQGLGAYVVTQFSFAPSRIVEYCADLARRAADVPVYVGLPGPTSPRTLLRYAQRCGVGASLRALQAQGMGAVRLFTNVDP